jgi:hypothetical protein
MEISEPLKLKRYASVILEELLQKNVDKCK